MSLVYEKLIRDTLVEGEQIGHQAQPRSIASTTVEIVNRSRDLTHDHQSMTLPKIKS